MSNTRVQSIAESITRKFGRYECKACADALEAELRRIGASGAFLQLEALGARPFIVMRDLHFVLPWPGGVDETITRNGFHYGIRVEDTVFDNVHKRGIAFKDWQDSFECAGGRFKLSIREFGSHG